MRLLHTAGFDAAERESFRLLIFNNITSTVQTIVEAMDTLQIDFEDRQLEVKGRLTAVSLLNSWCDDFEWMNRNLYTCLMIPRRSVKTNPILLITWFLWNKCGQTTECRVLADKAIPLHCMTMSNSKSQKWKHQENGMTNLLGLFLVTSLSWTDYGRGITCLRIKISFDAERKQRGLWKRSFIWVHWHIGCLTSAVNEVNARNGKQQKS